MKNKLFFGFFTVMLAFLFYFSILFAYADTSDGTVTITAEVVVDTSSGSPPSPSTPSTPSAPAASTPTSSSTPVAPPSAPTSSTTPTSSVQTQLPPLSPVSPPVQSPTSQPAQQPAVTPAGVYADEHLTISDVIPLAAGRTVQLSFVGDTVSDLTGDTLSFAVPESSLSFRRLISIDLVVDGASRPFIMNTSDSRYYADITVPNIGIHQTEINIVYEGAADTLRFYIQSLPFGIIMRSGTNASVGGAEVALIDINAGSLWNAANFNQQNPVIIGENGAYGFVVPNGRYQIVARKSGYFERRTPVYEPNANIFNQSIYLIPQTQPIIEAIEPGAPIYRNIINVVENFGERISGRTRLAAQSINDVVIIVREFTNEPAVQDVAKNIVAPVSIGAAAAVIIPSLWSILFPLLRFLFLQPILVLGKRKREEWGQVYNTYTKLPIELAIVRLLDFKTGKILQTRVTDSDGRYLFVSEPGIYKISAYKNGFIFPSKILSSVRTDGRLVDIYHEEEVVVMEDKATITPNIPLDPIGEEKRPSRILREKRLRVIQHTVSIVGIVATASALIIAVTWYTALFLALHITLYASFIIYALPKKPKGWGIVYDSANKTPVGLVTARLFTKEYNKLVDTQITDEQGRYAFLVGPNDYYVTFEKEGYKKHEYDALLKNTPQNMSIVKNNILLEREKV